MNTYFFKTDIHCKGCVSKLEKALLNKRNVQSWKINLDTKILEIQGDIQDLQAFEDQVFEQSQVYIEQIKDWEKPNNNV